MFDLNMKSTAAHLQIISFLMTMAQSLDLETHGISQFFNFYVNTTHTIRCKLFGLDTFKGLFYKN